MPRTWLIVIGIVIAVIIAARIVNAKKQQNAIRQLMNGVQGSSAEEKSKACKNLCDSLTLKALDGKELNRQIIYSLAEYRAAKFAAEAVKNASNSQALAESIREYYIGQLLCSAGFPTEDETKLFEKICGKLEVQDFARKKLSREIIYHWDVNADSHCFERIGLSPDFIVDVVKQAPNSSSLKNEVKKEGVETLLKEGRFPISNGTFLSICGSLNAKDFAGKELSREIIYRWDKNGMDSALIVDVVKQAPNSSTLINGIKEDGVENLIKEGRLPISEGMFHAICGPLSAKDFIGNKLSREIIYRWDKNGIDPAIFADAVKQVPYSITLIEEIKEDGVENLMKEGRLPISEGTFYAICGPLNAKDFAGKKWSKEEIYILSWKIALDTVADIVIKAPNSKSLIKEILDDIPASSHFSTAEKILKAVYQKGRYTKEIKAKDGAKISHSDYEKYCWSGWNHTDYGGEFRL